ncbi:MAG: transglutaminaseTgpA domain-containing protein, partial [Candidatus Omnitrophica bacterium]|nr:transglutaminaseTgpA domain-containing protein [Candidatus Omnitrophota bacterium]
MNLIFAYIVTSLLIITALLSLGREFKYTPLYILFALLGLGLSFWQQKKQSIPYLKLAVNIILVALTVRALFPFFVGKPKTDMFTVLITTWVYFLILSTYIIYTKRDYYIIQGFSLGVIVYACFYATRNPLPLLGYTAAFLALWIMALRNINLFPDNKEESSVSYTADDVWREIKVGALLFFAMVILSLPFYFLLPRFNIPLLPMDQLLRQRYSTIYADFPKRGLIAYLSRNPRDIMSEKKESEGKTPSPAERGGTENQLDIRQDIKKPVFWHGEEPKDILLNKIKEINQQLQGLEKQRKKQELVKEEQKIKKEKQQLQKELRQAKDEYAKLAQTQPNLSAEELNNSSAAKQIETL